MAKKAARKRSTRKKLSNRAPSRGRVKRAKVRIETLAVADLADAPYNPRIATQEAMRGLGNSLQDFGLIAHPVVNETEDGYTIVGGHKRVELLRDAGVEEVDCIVVQLDDDTERHANLTLNNQEIQGRFVPDLLKDVLGKLRELSGDDAERVFGRLRFDQLQRSVFREMAKAADPKKQRRVSVGQTQDDAIPQVKRTKAVSKLGTVYQLGAHRLYCGRISEPTSLQPVFGVDQVDLTVTRLSQSEPYTEEFLSVILGHALQNTEGALYVASNFDSLPSVQEMFLRLGGHWSSTIVAYRPRSTGARDDLYHDTTVPIMYGWREGAPHFFYGGRNEPDVMLLDGNPPKTDAPVEALVRAIQNSTTAGQSVMDPWMAHGASLIAAEKTGRVFYGYVHTPREMDRIRERWTKFVHGAKADWRKKTSEVSA